MSRGLTDPTPQEEPDARNELDEIIREIIIGQNKLHDRLVQLERQLDHLVQQPTKQDKKFKFKGL